MARSNYLHQKAFREDHPLFGPLSNLLEAVEAEERAWCLSRIDSTREDERMEALTKVDQCREAFWAAAFKLTETD